MPGARVLWIGGSSALARTYFEEVHPARGVPSIIAAAPAPPDAWDLPSDVPFVPLDLSSEESVRTLFSRLPHAVDAVLFGVRASLVYGTADEHERLANNLGLLLRVAASAGVTSVLHISSIAVADHVTAQHLVRESDPVPSLDQIASPYDRFKLRSEHVVDDVCGAPGSPYMVWTHLRISGIFSNDPRCIQCTAIRRQARFSVATGACIDFNSSRNVAHALALVLERQHASDAAYSGRQLFYYTRCTQDPQPYWHHVRDYRAANGLRCSLWLPGSVGDLCVPPLRRLLRAVGTDLAKSLDYLVAVASHEHSADNGAFRAAFSEMGGIEETILECFSRLRHRNAAARTEGGGGGRSRRPLLLFVTRLLLAVAAVSALLPVLVAAALPPACDLWLYLSPPPPPPPPLAWWELLLAKSPW